MCLQNQQAELKFENRDGECTVETSFTYIAAGPIYDARALTCLLRLSWMTARPPPPGGGGGGIGCASKMGQIVCTEIIERVVPENGTEPRWAHSFRTKGVAR